MTNDEKLDSNPWIRDEDKAAIRLQRQLAPTLD